jgi:hypothetical protein
VLMMASVLMTFRQIQIADAAAMVMVINLHNLNLS